MMKFKGVLLATAGGVAAAGGAQAADLPLKAAPMMPVPAATWAGAYVGLHAGAIWQTSHAALSDYSGAKFSTEATGFIGGGQIGYNWQSGNVVYGVEADISGLTGSGHTSGPADPGPGKGISGKINWLSTFRGRLGVASGNVMGYVTGGLAVGGVENSAAVFFLPNSLKSESKTRVGWTVGAGFEYMFSRNWTVGAEALYVDLGSHTVNALDPTLGKTSKFSNKATIARLKLNYKW